MELYTMAKTISKAVQNIYTAKHKEAFINNVEKNNFFDNYKKETDKNKKIEMLREASKEGWI